MSAARLFLFLFLLTFWNSFLLFAQDTTPNLAPAQKILLNGQEYYLHVVQRGEGLYRIGINYGVSQQEILKANDDITENLKIGQIIRIPVIKGRNSNNYELSRAKSFMYHTVAKGETAFSIARKYNIPIETIYDNNLGTRDGLVEGVILKIPAQTANANRLSVQEPDSAYLYHTVLPGETLYAIAREYHTTVEVIVEANPGLRNGVLAIGSVVRVPKETTDPLQKVKATDDGTQRFIEGERYLYHTIQPGQTFFSISRQYQVTVESLKAANPGLVQEDLTVGYLLRVPRPQVVPQHKPSGESSGRMFTSHKVRRKETLYGISREYHVDMETIKLLNPTVDFTNLDKGTMLKIPTDAWFASRTATVLEAEPVDSLDEQEAAAMLFTGDCAINTTLGYEHPIRVAVLFPFSARETSRFYNESDTARMIRSLPASANRSKVFAEFYSGMLLALDTLKKQGVKIDLSVYDIAPDSLALKRVLSDGALLNADLIIGPALASELPLVSAFSYEHKIPLVYPMSNTDPELRHNPYLFHVNTPDSLYYDQMAGEIVRQADGANLVVVMPSDQESGAWSFARFIKQKVEQHTGKPIQFTQYHSKGNDLEKLQTIISKEVANYVVVPTVKEAEVSKIIPVLAGVKELTQANITLFGTSDWLRYQTIDPEQIHLLNGSVFSPFGLDYHQQPTRNFISKYRQWYFTEPHAISPYFQSSGSASNFSRYGIWGYDVASFFLTALARYGSDFDLCLDQFQHENIQFNFNFKRVSNWGGFYNQGLFLLKFNSDFSTERIPLRNP